MTKKDIVRAIAEAFNDPENKHGDPDIAHFRLMTSVMKIIHACFDGTEEVEHLYAIETLERERDNAMVALAKIKASRDLISRQWDKASAERDNARAEVQTLNARIDGLIHLSRMTKGEVAAENQNLTFFTINTINSPSTPFDLYIESSRGGINRINSNYSELLEYNRRGRARGGEATAWTSWTIDAAPVPTADKVALRTDKVLDRYGYSVIEPRAATRANFDRLRSGPFAPYVTVLGPGVATEPAPEGSWSFLVPQLAIAIRERDAGNAEVERLSGVIRSLKAENLKIRAKARAFETRVGDFARSINPGDPE